MAAKTVGIVGLSAALFFSPAFGHHSHAMYDSAEPILIKGTVKAFDWTNPHCWLYIIVTNEAGQTLEWSLEMGSTASLAQEGWRPKTVVPGDAVSVALHPLKEDLRPLSEGRTVGSLVAIALPNGTHIGDDAYLK